jgi:hypothetical protein
MTCTLTIPKRQLKRSLSPSTYPGDARPDRTSDELAAGLLRIMRNENRRGVKVWYANELAVLSDAELTELYAALRLLQGARQITLEFTGLYARVELAEVW